MQAPDFSQSFNRYSYAWNNPLKFTDPDGEVIVPILIGMAKGALIGAAYSAATHLGLGIITGNWDGFWTKVGMGALGVALGGGLGVLGAKTGLGQSLGYNVSTRFAGNTATDIAFGGKVTWGSAFGNLAGSFLHAGMGNFSGVEGSALKNIGAELLAETAKGAFIGYMSSFVQGAFDGCDEIDPIKGALNGARNGFIIGAKNILALGAAYKPKYSYGNFENHQPVYRRGTPLTRLLGSGSGVAIGRHLLVHRYKDNEWSWPNNNNYLDNMYLEAHKTKHFIQQNQMGFANFYAQILLNEYVKYGFGGDYTVPGTLEYGADQYGLLMQWLYLLRFRN